MGRVTIQINDKPYVIGCEEGGEDYLISLGQRIDAKVRQVAPEASALGDTRLMLVAALMIADELRAAETRLTETESRVSDIETAMEELETKVVDALERAADRLEEMAPDLETGQLQLL